jgi:hypothetical protein
MRVPGLTASAQADAKRENEEDSHLAHGQHRDCIAAGGQTAVTVRRPPRFRPVLHRRDRWPVQPPIT